MGLFKFFRRYFTKNGREWARLDKLDRVDYLLAIYHDMLENPRPAQGGMNYLEMVERQLDKGEIDLALFNFTRQFDECFKIASLYWSKGDMATAEKYLRMTLGRYRRFIEAAAEHGKSLDHYKNYNEAYVKAAAFLLDEKLEGAILTAKQEPGYLPAMTNYILDCCLGWHDFDMGNWHTFEDAWLKNRFPRYEIEQHDVYVKALTGGFASDAEMLEAHARMWRGKAKRNPDAGLLEGYGDDNTHIVDYLFAAILKRIGWQGRYRHSWPGTCPADVDAETKVAAHDFVKVIEAPPPAPDSESGVIEDPQAARRFIDMHVKDQRDWFGGKHFDAARPANQRSKVAKSLKDLGWKADKETLDLMRSYQMSEILNDSTHIFLSDPVGEKWTGMKGWTELMVGDYGLHPDFIPVAESEEKSDWMDPQGGWYVFWKKDKRIYSVQRDDWDTPESAISGARLGKEMWPSYVSFVAWWVAQHQKGEV